ncbi:hypothetical protein CDAR_278951 [Caerostris darwini]|uniref:Uncharacterized protein n=1 Tax=Caerostris darwini TaxID=1538125 RepID=A0AAV4WRB4_9ARAC|nr:hypothetical protein CDAR_278951 [Caerostris darwini]
MKCYPIQGVQTFANQPGSPIQTNSTSSQIQKKKMDGCFIRGGNSRPAELSCQAATAHECVVAERAAVNIIFSFSRKITQLCLFRAGVKNKGTKGLCHTRRNI